MAELPNRRRHEASITGAAFLLLLKQRTNIADGHFNQRNFVRGFRESMTPRLQKIYESSFRALTKIYGVSHDAKELSQRFASDLSKKLAQEIASNVAEDISEAAARAAREERNRGEILQDLAERFGKSRAKAIGVTETTRAATAGERDAVRIIRRETGIVLTARWYTSRMANVCDICSPLHDTPQSIWRRRFPLGPPAHPRCILPGAVVDAQAVAAFRSFYSGDAVEFRTAGGVTLAVTPNHPVLTDKGFVSANALREGDKLLRYGGVGEIPGLVTDNHRKAESRIEDVFSAMAKRFKLSGSTNASAIDFHGDGKFINGQIDIVGPARMLLTDVNAESYQFGGKNRFVGSDMQLLGMSRKRSGLFLGGGMCPACSSFPSRSALSLNNRSITGSRFPKQLGLFGRGADGGPIFQERAVESGGSSVGEMASPGDPEFARKLVNRFAGVVSRDDVVNVRNVQFSGHVYDLQTVQGWYCCNGIIVHNCNCYLEYETD